MNKLMKFSWALSLLITMISCSESTAQSKEAAQEVSTSGKMQMNIEGMTCAMGLYMVSNSILSFQKKRFLFPVILLRVSWSNLRLFYRCPQAICYSG